MPDHEPTPGWAMYLRVSNEDKQTPERSFAMQRQRIEEFLFANSTIPFQREYCDVLTGTTSRRADYQQMLTDAEAGRFSHLALYRADRFGRDALEGLQAATRLISFGVRIRVAYMPSLCPETPDGFFMFMLQMGLAQREVEVMRQRISDGMMAKLRAGGWTWKAPDGYLNKEQLISSGKYHRWVELDQARKHILREAWDLLLTDRYSLIQICEELAARGYTRGTGKPWAWERPKTGARDQCTNYLSKIFNNPFYAGWVVSPKYGITMGEVRGDWEQIIETDEFERGLEILKKHHMRKSREKKQFYLLRDLLWLETNGKQSKMYCSTPTGRSRSYSYYLADFKQDNRRIHLRCQDVDTQIPDWVKKIAIDPSVLPNIRQVYQATILQVADGKRDSKIAEYQRRISQLREEEAQLARLLVAGKISEETYDRLRGEWQEKLRNTQRNLDDLQRDIARHVDDLDSAIVLLATAYQLYLRLDDKQRHTLLRILAKRIVVDAHGEIIDYELYSPFVYLTSLLSDTGSRKRKGRGLRKAYPDTQIVDSTDSPADEVSDFFSMLRFENKAKLSELPNDWQNI